MKPDVERPVDPINRRRRRLLHIAAHQPRKISVGQARPIINLAIRKAARRGGRLPQRKPIRPRSGQAVSHGRRQNLEPWSCGRAATGFLAGAAKDWEKVDDRVGARFSPTRPGCPVFCPSTPCISPASTFRRWPGWQVADALAPTIRVKGVEAVRARNPFPRDLPSWGRLTELADLTRLWAPSLRRVCIVSADLATGTR
jgi:hypothetical protein